MSPPRPGRHSERHGPHEWGLPSALQKTALVLRAAAGKAGTDAPSRPTGRSERASIDRQNVLAPERPGGCCRSGALWQRPPRPRSANLAPVRHGATDAFRCRAPGNSSMALVRMSLARAPAPRPSIEATPAVLSGQADALKASTCGKMMALASPWGSLSRVPRG